MPAFFSRWWIKRLLSNMSLHTFRIMSANIHKNLRFLCHQLPKMHNLSTLCSLFQLLPLKTWNFFVTFAFCIRYIVLPNRAYTDRDTMSEMRYANTKILIVTRYCKVRNADVPSLYLRSAFVLPSLQVRSHRWSIYGLTTDLQRTCILGSWKFSQNLIEACI